MLGKKIRSYTFYELFFYFLIYSVLGWTFETMYTFVCNGFFQYRGFLYLPLCPVYGIAMLAAILLLEPIQDKVITLYAGSVILITVIEYITGTLLLTIFDRRWWDYSNELLNLNGHVTLFVSLWWGFGFMLVIRFIHPKIISIVEKIVVSKGRPILVVSYFLLFIDIIASITVAFIKR